MRKRFFPLIIALSALAVSGSAAFYSVFGLSKLFAGASLQVIIMAGSLEFAKLVVASLLYQYWGTINKVLRAYLAVAVLVLVMITSGGIYGFLSGAYQETATQSELLDKSLIILNQKNIRFQEQKSDLIIEKNQLSKSISDLRISLSNPAQVQYIDKESGQLITTTSSSARRALQSELKNTITDRDQVNLKIESILDSINKTDMALLNKEISNEAESELGPLKYLAEITGKDMNVVVNWFLLLIIFVFDPLAISMVIAANFAFAQLKRRTSEVEMSVPPGLKFNTPYTMDEIKDAFEKNEPSEELKQRVKENQAKLKDQEYSQTNWDKAVASLGPNPNSITESVKLEKKDLVVDDMEELPLKLEEEKWLPEEPEEEFHEGKQMAKGLDTFIDVLEQEEKELAQDPTLSEENKSKSTESSSEEHELYHGKPKPTRPAYSDMDKRKRRRGGPKQYKYRG